MLAMVGVPPAVGFAGKWYIALGAVRAGTWPVAVVIFASTLLTLGYFALLVERMFVAPAGPTAATATDGGTEAEADDGADGGADVGSSRPGRSALALVIGAAVAAVVLGFAVTDLQTALEPTIDTLLSP
jgi:multicomponent Na+:H+ antiporter subunit D